jgi:nucleoside-diphosphate-sugar epimerase
MPLLETCQDGFLHRVIKRNKLRGSVKRFIQIVRWQNMNILENYLTSDDRVLVTGSSGWFGKTATVMARELNLKTLCVSSSSRTYDVAGTRITSSPYDLLLINDFDPTIVIDTAFVTRDLRENFTLDDYISINRQIIGKSMEIASLSSVRKYVGFSSGATVNLAGQASFSLLDNPYAALKREYEDGICKLSGMPKGKISIARVWSVTGTHLTKPDLFAFSNLISQARSGRIVIKANNLVFRRFCTIDEVISVALADSGKHGPIFDTGGELIEIGELAEIVRQEVNPQAEIVRGLRDGTEPDNYYSDGKVWDELLKNCQIKPATIREQVRAVAESLNM